MKSKVGLIASALLSAFGFGRSGKELPFDPYASGKAFARGWKVKRRRRNSGASSNCRNQPAGYYEQEITDPKYMTPRQRAMHAIGQRIILGQFYGQPR